MALALGIHLEAGNLWTRKPGNVINGHILVSNSGKKPAKVEELWVNFLGQELVEWKVEKCAPRCCFYGAGCIYSCTKKETYRDGSNFIDETVSLLGETTIPVGEHRLPFRFILPQGCPSSYGFSQNKCDGHIAYCISTKLKTVGMFKMNKKESCNFPVAGVLDLNEFDDVANPVVQEKVDKKGKRKVTVQLPKQGFLPGEVILFKIHLQVDPSNKKKYPPPLIKLIKEEYLIAQSFGTQTKTYTSSVAKQTTDVASSPDFDWVGSIQLPKDLEYTNHASSQYMRLMYRFQVTALGWNDIVIPILIGSVPFGQQDVQVQSEDRTTSEESDVADGENDSDIYDNSAFESETRYD